MEKSLSQFFLREKILKERGEKILGFTLTSPTFPPPPLRGKILNFYKFSFSYSPAGGDLGLKEVLANFYSKKWQVNLKKENVFVGNGGKEVLFILLQVLLKKRGEVILISPYWPSYLRMVKMAGGKLKVLKTSEKQEFYPNLKELEKKISPKTKALILNSPCNPTGKILRQKEVEYLAELSLKRNFILISDEVYEIYDFENLYCSFLKFFHKNIFCVFSASKTFSLCGWRLGWGFGNKNLIEEMKNYQSDLSTSPHTLSQILIREIFKEEKKVLRYFLKNKKLAKERRDFAINFLKEREINFVFPEGGIAIFIKIPFNFKDAFSFSETLLEKERVSVAPGEVFGHKNYFRINIALPLKDLKEGLRRIAKYYP
jgi:aspartate aminotransferase